MKENYIIIHGSFGSPFINWFSWLQANLSNAIVPQFPIGVGMQTYDNWSKLLKYYFDLGLINSNTTLIGHSIAPIFIIKFLLENKIKVNKLVFVSGFNNVMVDGGDYDQVNSSFYIKGDIKTIKDYANEIICFYSNNDPYVPLNDLKMFADEVATRVLLIPNGGHLNSESGYNSFKELLDVLK